MPLYTYENEETGETIDVVQSMDSEHKYFQDGKEWKRVFSIPAAVMDSKISPWDQKKFVEKTGNAKGTYGDLISRSAEMSEKRAKESPNGIDPIKQKSIEQYSKDRRGRKFVDKM